MDVTVDRAWWVGEGFETCPFCHEGYAVEVEVRCVDCDAPGCPFCVVRVRRETEHHLRCPTCLPEAPR